MSTTRKEFIVKSLAAATGFSTGLTALTDNFTSKRAAPNRRQAESIQVGIFSKHLQWLDSYESMAETAAEIGFDGVDLTVRNGGHVLPENAARDLPRAVKAVRDAGLEVLMMTTGISSVDEEHTETVLKTASDLGIPNYRTGGFRYSDDQTFNQNLDTIKGELSRLAQLNEQLEIQADIQNHDGSSFAASILDTYIVLEDIGSEWLGAQYDVRHATVEGSDSWTVGLMAIHPHIGTLDIKDFIWEKDEGNDWADVPLGTGAVEWDNYFTLLKQYGITAPMSLHYEQPLGGANRGRSELTIPEEEVITAIQRDHDILRGWLNKYEL